MPENNISTSVATNRAASTRKSACSAGAKSSNFYKTRHVPHLYAAPARRSAPEGTTLTPSAGLANEIVMPQMDADAKKLFASKLGRVAISVSPSGLLFPYYLGVFRALEELGCLQQATLAGASGGGLIGAFALSGLSPDEAEAVTRSLYASVMSRVSRTNLLEEMKGVLRDTFPDDIHERASGRLVVAVTQVRPEWKGLLLDTFSSKEDLLDVLCASCSFMPLNVRGTECVDGLLTSFFPPLPPTATFDTLLKVCSVPCFLRPYNRERADISPDGKQEEEDHFGPLEMLMLAGQPSTKEQLDRLTAHGYRDAMAWAATV